jgi:hypothetical protein
MSLIPFMTDFGSFKIALRSIRPPLPNRLAIKQAGLTACLACLIGNQASQQAKRGPACLLACPLDRKYIYEILVEI